MEKLTFRELVSLWHQACTDPKNEEYIKTGYKTQFNPLIWRVKHSNGLVLTIKKFDEPKLPQIECYNENWPGYDKFTGYELPKEEFENCMQYFK